jgi:hypothetical protein
MKGDGSTGKQGGEIYSSRSLRSDESDGGEIGWGWASKARTGEGTHVRFDWGVEE